MENEEFKRVWGLLNRRYQEVGDGSTIGKSLNPAGIVSFAERVKRDIDEFIGEVIARAKAADEDAAATAELNREQFGDRYEQAQSEHRFGLRFGDKEPV
jgi:hypothetical protein